MNPILIFLVAIIVFTTAFCVVAIAERKRKKLV